MLKVLHVIGSLESGGSQTLFLNIFKCIDRSKIQFDFLIHRPDELFYADEVRKLGGKIYVLPAFKGYNILKYIKAWKEFFAKHPEYDIIHGHVRSTAAIYLKIARKYKYTTISHSHSISSGKGLRAVIKNIMQYPIRHISDYFIACSDEAGKWLFGKKICDSGRYIVLNNAINYEDYLYNEDVRVAKRKELDFGNKLVIGHVGRFIKTKNHSFLIDIFEIIHKKNKEALLVLVGDGELRHVIERRVHDRELSDCVIFAGARSDVPQLLQAMDVFVLPSLFEGLGIVLIEAQASGLVSVVSSRIPKEAYISDLIIPVSLKESPAYWANSILQQNKSGTRRNMSDVMRSSGFDINETTKKIEEYYLKISG